MNEASLRVCPVCGGDGFRMFENLSPALIEEWGLTPAEAHYINLQQGLTCTDCNSSLRVMTLAAALCEHFDFPKHFSELCSADSPIYTRSILEMNPAGSLTHFLSKLPNHKCVCYPEIDLQRLPFPDESFDVILHSDTLEHVEDSPKALRECYRVLKPKAILAYTIPIVHGRLTIKRLGLKDSFHGPHDERPSDMKVVSEYGADFYKEIFRAGFSKTTLFSLRFPASVAIIAHKLEGEVMPLDITTTGCERARTDMHGDIQLEHLHRYALAAELVAGKDVLDIACGEGYGSNLLAASAKMVIGVDISEPAIRRADAKYQRANLQFKVGSCTEIPLEDNSVDVVASFETIEHISQHEEMMSELKRVLRTDGLLIISSPDKYQYSDVQDYDNEFHVKELYLNELRELLKTHFTFLEIFGQRVYYGSFVAPLNEDKRIGFLTHTGNWERIERCGGTREPLYFVAVASNRAIPSLSAGVFWNKDLQLAEMDRLLAEKEAQFEARLAEKDALIEDIVNSSSWRLTAPLRWGKRRLRELMARQ